MSYDDSTTTGATMAYTVIWHISIASIASTHSNIIKIVELFRHESVLLREQQVTFGKDLYIMMSAVTEAWQLKTHNLRERERDVLPLSS